MSEIEQTVHEIAAAGTWQERIHAVRRIPERHGRRDQAKVYAAVAGQLYRPYLSPEFAFVPERPEYELEVFSQAYRRVHDATRGFSESGLDRITAVLEAHPETLLVLRTILGYTPSELSVASREVGGDDTAGVSAGRIKGFERGSRMPPEAASVLAATIDRLIMGSLWGEAPEGLRTKLDKIDTSRGWTSVRELAAAGVPYDAFLHLKAARFGVLREEAIRLGGIPVVAVVDGLGWERLNDALGPVVRDCDGRVFTLQTLPEMLEVEPFPALAHGSPG